MKPLFSDDEKKQAVRTFLIALQHNRAKITSYIAIKNRINSDQMKVLCKLSKSGHDRIIIGSYDTGTYHIYYTDGDAQTYFEWLVSVVSGTLSDTVEDDIMKRANDQLFMFIQVMQQSGTVEIDPKIQMIEPYDWQNLFSSFNERLINMQEIIDKSDKDIIEVLKPLLQLTKENKTLLKKLLKESEEPFGR